METGRCRIVFSTRRKGAAKLFVERRGLYVVPGVGQGPLGVPRRRIEAHAVGTDEPDHVAGIGERVAHAVFQPADDGESFLSGLHIAGIDEARGVRGRRLLRVRQPVCRKGERVARGRAQRGGEDVALAVRQREGLQARRDLSGDGPGLLQGAVRAGRRRGGQQRRKAELDASSHDGGAHGRQKYLFP